MSSPNDARRSAENRPDRPSGAEPSRSEAEDAASPGGGEQPGMFQAHAWLTPVVVLASIVAIFVAMMLLTWAGGGGSLFGM